MSLSVGSADDLRADVARRLRSMCAHMPQEKFGELVERIVSLKLKYGVVRLTPDAGTDRVID